LQAALDKHTIDKWEHEFYMGILEKEALSEKQTHYKDRVEFKVSMHAAKDKKVLNDFEHKFVIDNFGKQPDAFSEKQLAVKQGIDAKLEPWKAFRANAISDWDLEFMISNIKRDSWTVRQLPIKERIEKQMEVATAVREDQVLTEWEVGFFKDTAMKKDCQALSEKQRPIMERIEKKLQAWRAHRAGLLNKWQLDFVKDVAGKETLSEKQQSKLEEIEEKMRIPVLPSFVSDPHSSDEELAGIPL